MLSRQILTLMPSFVFHLGFSVALACAAWFALSRAKGWTTINWQLPVIGGAALSVFLSVNTVVGLRQTMRLMEFAQVQQGAAQEAETKLKSEFLQSIEQIVSDGSKAIDEPLRKSFFAKYLSLFPNGISDKQAHLQAIFPAYECQRLFLDDALAAYRQQKPVKSETRGVCEKLGGQYFNRQALVPQELAQNNAATIQTVSRHEKVRDPAGKMLEVNEAALEGALKAQQGRIERLKQLLQ